MPEDKFSKFEFPLNGKLITSRDSTTIGPQNFKQLTNMRYKDTNPYGVRGMSKINTTSINGKPYIKSGYHYVKDQPSESHIIVQAWNSTLDASAIYECTTDIPNQGNFQTTALLSEPSNSAVGVFSNSPSGHLAYCNKQGAYLWGGNEARLGSFINYSPNNLFRYNYTDNLIDNQTSGANHLATLYRTSETASDSNTKVLLHFTSATTDSSASRHTIVNTNVVIKNKATSMFSYSGTFDGTAYLTVPKFGGHDFGTGNFSIEALVKVSTTATQNYIYHQHDSWATNDAHIDFEIDTSGRVRFNAYKKSGAATLGLKSPTGVITAGTKYHIEVDESGDNWYLFVDGQLQSYRSNTFRCLNLQSSTDIGKGDTAFFNGNMDEFRISNVARRTSNFELPAQEYDATISYRTYAYIGSTLPLQGFKIYVGTANTSTGTMNVDYWNGTDWTGVSSLSDGTASGGKPLAQTGTVSFDSTESNAKVKIIDGTVLYWYRVRISDCDNTTVIYKVTLDAPFQTVKDIWDGINDSILSFQVYNGTSYDDYTTNVYQSDYISQDYTGTYASLDGLTTSEYFVCGFSREQLGVSFDFVSGKGNTTPNTICYAYYWNGTAWTSVGDIDDGTSQNGKSLSKSGVISWSPPNIGSEFTTEITKEVPLFYYKFRFTQTLSGDVQPYYINGFPAQREIGKYSFPVLAMNRLWFLSEQDRDKNAIIASSAFTSQVFNGTDSLKFYIGDEKEVISGTSIYMQLGSSLYEGILIHKRDESWIIFYSDNQFYQFRISQNIGCIAPHTVKSVIIGDLTDPNSNKEIPIWQAADGLYMFNGRGPIPIDNDIEDIFRDSNSSSAINKSYSNISYSFFDPEHKEYHWLYAISNTLDTEVVIDVRRQKAFNINRGTGNKLLCGFQVKDTTGNSYTYGSKGRYVERLENGNSFDGTAISHTMWLGDVVLNEGSIIDETTVRNISLMMAAKNNTSATLSGRYYIDTTATPNKIFDMGVTSSKRLAMPIQQLGGGVGYGTFHSFKFDISTSNETTGFEPVYMGILYRHKRQKFKE